MRWWTAAIETSNLAWPTEETTVTYKGEQFLLRPETNDLLPSVSIHCSNDISQEEAQLSINRFLSAFCWAKNGGAHIPFWSGSGGKKPINVGKSNVRFVCDKLRTDYLPAPENEKSFRALAIYREAMSVNTISFKYLGFFKVINVIFNRGPEQKVWINANIDHVKDFLAVERLEEIKKTGEDIGEYLYKSGRCAVAHAFDQPTVDPDIPAETLKLRKDLPVIQELAKILIESELGIITESTFRREHLYELQGFAELIGPERVQKIKAAEPIGEDLVTLFPKVSVRLRDHDPFDAYECMTVKYVKQIESILSLLLESQDGFCVLELQLDFSNWRLLFDSEKWVHIKEDEDKSVTPIRYNIDQIKFLQGHLGNGQVEVYEASNYKLLARTDPLIPCNIDFRATKESLNKLVEHYTQAIEERQRNTQ